MSEWCTVTDRVIVAMVAVIALYDIAACLLGGGEATISARLQHHATRYPVIPLVAGMLVGHVFWNVFALRNQS